MTSDRVDPRRTMRVLVADDDRANADDVRGILVSAGYKKVKVRSAISSLTLCEGYDLVIIDIVWPEEARPPHETSPYFGLTAVKHLQRHQPGCRTVLMSRHLFDLDHLDDIAAADAFFRSGAAPAQLLSLVSDLPDPDRNNPSGGSFQVLGNSVSAVGESRSTALLALAEEVVRDGRADLLGLSEDSYKVLVKELMAMRKGASEVRPDVERGTRLKRALELAQGANHVVRLLESIRDWLP